MVPKKKTRRQARNAVTVGKKEKKSPKRNSQMNRRKRDPVPETYTSRRKVEMDGVDCSLSDVTTGIVSS